MYVYIHTYTLTHAHIRPKCEQSRGVTQAHSAALRIIYV